ncbi:TIGR02266 family protein [Myxococcota bacterium]|nr:TIGR02266 family protein [Myxococcota bacterium]
MASVILEGPDSEPTHLESERRKAERIQLVVRVEYSTIDDFFSEFSRDINQGGLFIETSRPLSLGSEVMMRFNLPGGDDVIETVGHVVRISHGDGQEPPGMGLEFEKLRNDDRIRIDRLVRMLRA